MEDGGPSVTASGVAAHRLGFALVATDYGDPAADEALAADVAAGRAAPANHQHPWPPPWWAGRGGRGRR